MTSQKPSWFKMDPSKFLADVAVDSMTTTELGACFRLLCRQWIDGDLPSDIEQLARLARLDKTEMRDAWGTLCAFFPEIEGGRRANRHMWKERAEIVNEMEMRSSRCSKAARDRWDQVRKTSDASGNASSMREAMRGAMQEENKKKKKKEKVAVQDAAPEAGAKVRKTKETLLADYSPGVREVISGLADIWPKVRPKDRSVVRVSQAAWAARLDAILEEHPSIPPECLLDGAKIYLGEEPEMPKAPQYFFGVEGPWLAYARMAFHKRKAAERPKAEEVSA